MSETALLENQNKIPLECSTQFIEEFSSSASSVPSSNNTKKLFKKSQQPQVNFLIKNSESDQDCNLTCFTNPLAEDLELDLEVTGSNPAEVITEAETVPLVVDPDLEIKVRRACERISENVHICANEPSLAFFRLSEHVRKALPPTVESRQQVQTIQRQLGVAYEDADVALQEVQSMEHAAPMLNSTMEMLKEAIKLQQQVKQEQSKRPKKEPSMYQRLSAHLTSVELLSDLRESASRISSNPSVENQDVSNQQNSTNSASVAVSPTSKMTRSESSLLSK
jgi:hypothetical protein